jgi:hypothetical protein
VFHDLAQFLQISRGEAAQVVIAFAGAAATTIAAVAAWRSAVATQASVAEMSSARHQSVRPLLHATATEEVLLRWGRDNPTKLYSAREEQVQPAITLMNIGRGTALDVRADLSSYPRYTMPAEDATALATYFEQCGLQFSHQPSRRRCMVEDQQLVRHFRRLYAELEALGLHHEGFQPLEPKGVLKVDLGVNSANLMLLDSFARLLTESRGRWSIELSNRLMIIDHLIVSYSSISGEKFKHHFWLAWSSFDITFYDGNGRRVSDQLPVDWDQVELRCRVRLLDVSKVGRWYKSGKGGEYPHAWRGSALPKPG